jgi:hypothetical protein
MIKNGWKQVLDNIYLHDFLLYTQLCSIGQQVVFNYPMVSPEVPTTLKTPYRYNMGHYSLSFVIKTAENRFSTLLTSIIFYSIHMLYGPTSSVQISFAITHGDYYTHGPKWLPYGAPYSIATHLWAKVAVNSWTVFGHFCSQMSGCSDL